MDIIALKERTTKWIGKYKYLVLILLLGIGLMLIPSKTKDESTIVQNDSSLIQTQSVAEELQDILTNIKGAGKVQVMLTVKSGEQTVYQTDTSSADRQDTVVITGDDRAQSGLVQQIIAPIYRGAIVLCQGADSANVCLAIKEAVSKVTGLDSSQISVLKMK